MLLVLASIGFAVTASAKLPSAQQILDGCQRAYDSVKTFEQDTVSTSGHYKGSAHISFSRPGKLRASGNTLFGSKYELLVAGRAISVYNNSGWATSPDAEYGLGAVTGVSGSAPTSVSSLLLHTSWGSLPKDSQAHFSVSSDHVLGRDTYRLQTKTPIPMSFWIDKKSYFLVKTHAFIIHQNLDVEFAPPKVNQPIPAGRFRQ